MRAIHHISHLCILCLFCIFAVGCCLPSGQPKEKSQCAEDPLWADVFPERDRHKVQIKFNHRGFLYVQVFDGVDWKQIEPNPTPIPVSSLAVRVLADVSPMDATSKGGVTYISGYLECAFDAVFKNSGFLNMSESVVTGLTSDLISVGFREEGPCSQPSADLAGLKECFVQHVERQLQNHNHLDYAKLAEFNPPSEFSALQIILRWRERVLSKDEIERLRDKSIIVFDFAEAPRQEPLEGVALYELPAPSISEMMAWPHNCNRFYNQIKSKIQDKYLSSLHKRAAELRTTKLLEIESKFLTMVRDIESPNSSPILGKEPRFRLWFKKDASSEEYCIYVNTKMKPSQSKAVLRDEALASVIQLALPVAACGMGPAFASFLYVIGVLTLNRSKLKEYIERYTEPPR